MPEDKIEPDLSRLTTIEQNDIVKIEVLRKNIEVMVLFGKKKNNLQSTALQKI